MVGQAPYVVNSGLSYANRSGSTSATLLYNVVGKRISSAAVTPVKVDTYEQPRPQLDFSLRFPMRGGISGKFDATNLLDAPYEELKVVLKRVAEPRVHTRAPATVSLAWTRSMRLNARAQAWVDVAVERFGSPGFGAGRDQAEVPG
jgi:hypothetical protein